MLKELRLIEEITNSYPVYKMPVYVQKSLISLVEQKDPCLLSAEFFSPLYHAHNCHRTKPQRHRPKNKSLV